MKKLETSPAMESMEQVSAFVEQELETADIPRRVITQINIVVDEIFSNIIRYSGASVSTVSLTVENERINLCFTDNGNPYDPMKKPDPDTNLSAEERDIGGLGFYIVKKSMDSVEYDYQDGFNILTVTKRYTPDA